MKNKQSDIAFYGSCGKNETPSTMSTKEILPKRNKWLSITAALSFVILLFTLLLFANTSQQLYDSPNTASVKTATSTETDDIATSWALYKYTTSISPGTYVAVQAFVNEYITQASYAYNLGCNETYKVVASIATPTSDIGLAGFEEIHWVDSSIFVTNGKSISDWSAYVNSLGYEAINPFMLNKVQLYVPDLQPHFTALSNDGITMVLRKSRSNGAIEIDTAHIGIPLSDAATLYELVGPFSSLTDDQQESFESWSTSECKAVHQLPYNISTYAELYDTIELSITDAAWTEKTGKYIPMGVAITIPTQSLDYITDTMNIASRITSWSSSTLQADACEMLVMDMYLDSDGNQGSFGPYVRYVDATSAMTVTSDNVSDWESDISNTHDLYLNMNATYSGWDRYLDTHLGILTEMSDSTICSDNEANIESVLASSVQEPSYSIRDSEGVHFYTGTKGLKAWEFNLFGCSSDYTNICGCLADNNEDEFLVDHSSCSNIGTVSTLDDDDDDDDGFSSTAHSTKETQETKS